MANEGSMLSKTLVIGIIFLFIVMSIHLSTGYIVEKSSYTTFCSNGYIQDLIDNASDGDTIYIPSGIYYENIVIDKSISLVGEDKDTTIIDGSEIGDVIYVSADWVNISGFTIQNSGVYYRGIAISSSNNTIERNVIKSNYEGIYLKESNCNFLMDNTLLKNGISLYLWFSNSNIISENIISEKFFGICFKFSDNNTIKSNNITKFDSDAIRMGNSENNKIIENNLINNSYGIFIYNKSRFNIIINNNIILNDYRGVGVADSCNNTIESNNISNNYYGISFSDTYFDCKNNKIYHNNLIDNYQNGYDLGENNSWDDGKYGNYWSDYEDKYPNARKKPFKGIWDTPYEIFGGNSTDRYPLIMQWSNSRTRTIQGNNPFNLNLLDWFFNRFPLLEVFLRAMKLLR